MSEKTRKSSVALVEPDHLATGSSAPGAAEHTLEQAIGNQVRHHRKHAGLTVAELAVAAQISPGMLSKIENGQISPSLSTLQMLAAALNIPLTALFASFEQRRDCSYVKSGEGVVIRRRGTKVGHQYQLLGHSLDGDVVVEPYLITLSDDAVPYTGFQHEGVEFIFMLSGEIEYAHADRSYLLSPGDAILFDSAAPHGPARLIKTPMTYLSIIIYQRP
ncbi:helix-turn-helix domain-containing protein [Hyphomicrobium sp.]|jgi:transcriptional regulator with XRE-family HTH domain|uniref:helix-turn-helix domain-containing protein n=1 Tax=Hyphomicrobium sp. TaxID=82 RepID=UPI002BC413A4|nr:helix-turn-helix domain-containing protein [Hyphomicrobium sp.]HVZ04360.1 helix-turn-helix domain-containing protein [Hyphomicrobium sp.]